MKHAGICRERANTQIDRNARLHHQMHVCTIKSDNFLCVTILEMCALIIEDRPKPEGQKKKNARLHHKN